MLKSVQTQKNKNHGNLKRANQEAVRGATEVRKSDQTIEICFAAKLYGNVCENWRMQLSGLLNTAKNV